jgi:hypothetical protein
MIPFYICIKSVLSLIHPSKVYTLLWRDKATKIGKPIQKVLRRMHMINGAAPSCTDATRVVGPPPANGEMAKSVCLILLQESALVPKSGLKSKDISSIQRKGFIDQK